MISFMLLSLLITNISCHVLLQTAIGQVSRGNFIYWTLNYNGNIIVKLVSINGDADLYVSEKLAKPDYEPDKYDLHSASCGEDIVYIPHSFKRPVGIGIYGHPSYENSSYLLEIYYDPEKEDEYIDFGKDLDDQNNEHTDSESKFKISRSIVISGFWALMEIFELLFT